MCCSFSPSLFAAAMTPSPRPKALVLGGTAFGLGVAVANPGRCVVIERSLHLAPEFSQVGDWGELGEAATEQGKALAEAIKSVGLVNDGRLELPPLSDFLHQYAAEKGVSFFCCADLVSFKRNAKVCRAVVYDLSDKYLKFVPSYVSNGQSNQPCYLLILPGDRSGTLSATYVYSLADTKPENIERYHRFMLAFLDNAMNEPELTIQQLIDKSL